MTPAMQKIRRYMLKCMNTKRGRLFLYTFRNCQRNIKMTSQVLRCAFVLANETSVDFLDRGSKALPCQIFAPFELDVSLLEYSQMEKFETKP